MCGILHIVNKKDRAGSTPKQSKYEGILGKLKAVTATIEKGDGISVVYGVTTGIEGDQVDCGSSGVLADCLCLTQSINSHFEEGFTEATGQKASFEELLELAMKEQIRSIIEKAKEDPEFAEYVLGQVKEAASIVGTTPDILQKTVGLPDDVGFNFGHKVVRA